MHLPGACMNETIGIACSSLSHRGLVWKNKQHISNINTTNKNNSNTNNTIIKSNSKTTTNNNNNNNSNNRNNNINNNDSNNNNNNNNNTNNNNDSKNNTNKTNVSHPSRVIKKTHATKRTSNVKTFNLVTRRCFPLNLARSCTNIGVRAKISLTNLKTKKLPFTNIHAIILIRREIPTIVGAKRLATDGKEKRSKRLYVESLEYLPPPIMFFRPRARAACACSNCG